MEVLRDSYANTKFKKFGDDFQIPLPNLNRQHTLVLITWGIVLWKT